MKDDSDIKLPLHCFTIVDHAVATWGTPFFMLSQGAALRAFNDLVNDPNSTINKHPDDYSLWHVGTFDQLTGYFKMHEDGPDRVATARDFIAITGTPLSIAKEG